VRVKVLPEPAPADTMSGASSVVTTARWPSVQRSIHASLLSQPTAGQ
jgi:hypothetical protein